MDAAVGDASTVRVRPDTVTATAPFVKFNCTDDAFAGVPVPTTTTAVVPFATEQDVAGVPELGVAPTLAMQEPVNSEPVTVMVLPT